MQAKLFAMTLNCSKQLAAKDHQTIAGVVEQVRQLNLEDVDSVEPQCDFSARALVANASRRGRGAGKGGPRCFRCGEVGHKAFECPASKPMAQAKPAAAAARVGGTAASMHLDF
jgi:hypothetical protein